MKWPFGLYGAGMHDYVLREIEVGPRVALCEDMEACGDSALDAEPEPETRTRGPLPSNAREAADLTAKLLMADYPIPLVLTVDGETAIQADNPDTPVPFALTPEGEAAAAEPDTWTRQQAVPSMIEVIREWAGEPEPRS